jgi:penicillin-binding protein 2
VAFPDQIGERRPRVLVLTILIGCIFLLLGSRLFYLQIVSGDRYAQLARENMVRSEQIPAMRGRIFDREGRLLAGNRVSFIVSLEAGHPAYADRNNLKEAVEEVGRILELDVSNLEQRALRYRGMYEPLVLARDLAQEDLAPFIERLQPIPGITIGQGPMRWYPMGALAAHSLGYVGEISEEELRRKRRDGYGRGDFIGRSGLERRYESVLRGKTGRTYVEVDALGRKIDLFPDLPPIEPIPGADIHLSLDSELQRIAEEQLASVVYHQDTYRLRGSTIGVRGSIIAMDPWTGEVLVSASYPGFDPNAFAHGLSASQWAELNRPTHPLLNRIVQAAYPPGSIFKIITLLAGLDADLIDESTRFEPCHGKYRYGNREFGCWKDAGHGSMRLRQAFAQSCDIYFYQLARQMKLKPFLRFMGNLGLAEPTGIDLPDERAGLIPSVDWYRRHLGAEPAEGIALNLSIGQGEIVMTPLQIATMVSAVVTDGVMRRPYLANSAIDHTGTYLWRHEVPEDLRDLNIDEPTRQLVRGLLSEVVNGEYGTAKKAQVEGFEIGGKTGTSQNSHGEDHALFAAVAPIMDPEIVIIIVVEEAGGGGAVAAPLAQPILEAFLNRMTGPADSLAISEAAAVTIPNEENR